MNREFVQTMVGREDSLDSWRDALDAVRDRTAMGVHNVRLEEVDADRILLEMPMGDHARQVLGLLHGGVSAMLAETAASMHACWGADLEERAPIGIELNATHVRPATGGTIQATGHALRRGRTHVQHRVEIHHKGRDVLLSECRVINYLKPHGGGD